jgi:hypothetical protein
MSPGADNTDRSIVVRHFREKTEATQSTYEVAEQPEKAAALLHFDDALTADRSS